MRLFGYQHADIGNAKFLGWGGGGGLMQNNPMPGGSRYVGILAQGGDLVSSMPGCVCRKVKEMGPFYALGE